MKLRKHLKPLLALLLAIVTFLVPSLKAFAESKGKYISEVYVAYGKDASEAAQTLRDKGFTPVQGNLNEGGETYAMVGYKTTDDIRESVTDIAVMNMRGGYSVEDYKTLLKSQKSQIADFLQGFMAVIKEYRMNYEKERSNAKLVHELLNCYYDDDTGMKMGDLLLADTLQDKLGITESIGAENPEKLPDLITILLQGHVQVINSLEMILCMATDSADNSWIDRFAEKDYDDLLEELEKTRPDLNTEAKRIQYLDSLYGDMAHTLGVAAETLRQQLSDLDYFKTYIWRIDDYQENLDKFYEDLRSAQTSGESAKIIAAENRLALAVITVALKDYEGGRFAKGELYGFFSEEADPDDVERYYPLAAALSEGQKAAMPFISLTTLMKIAVLDEEAWSSALEGAKTASLDQVSVYVNINREIFEDDCMVAMTDAASRAANIDSWASTKDAGEQLSTLGKVIKISYISSALSTIMMLMSAGSAKLIVDATAYNPLTGIWNEDIIKAAYDAEAYAEAMAADNLSISTYDLKDLRTYVTVGRVFTAICLAIVIISAVLTVIDLLTDEGYEQLPIPKYLIDNRTDQDGGEYKIYYQAVECNREEYFGAGYTKQKGNSADLLCDEGKQWLTLYVSKNSRAGNPVAADMSVKNYDSTYKDTEDVVHIIGEKGAVNLADPVFKHYSTIKLLWYNATSIDRLCLHYSRTTDVKTLDESAGTMRASILSPGMAAIFGFGGIALGAGLGVFVSSVVRKKKAGKA